MSLARSTTPPHRDVNLNINTFENIFKLCGPSWTRTTRGVSPADFIFRLDFVFTMHFCLGIPCKVSTHRTINVPCSALILHTRYNLFHRLSGIVIYKFPSRAANYLQSAPMPSPVTDPFSFKYFHQVLPLGLRIKNRLRYCYAMEAKINYLNLASNLLYLSSDSNRCPFYD